MSEETVLNFDGVKSTIINTVRKMTASNLPLGLAARGKVLGYFKKHFSIEPPKPNTFKGNEAAIYVVDKFFTMLKDQNNCGSMVAVASVPAPLPDTDSVSDPEPYPEPISGGKKRRRTKRRTTKRRRAGKSS